METIFHQGNRRRLYQELAPASLLILFSGREVRKTNDEYYPFFTDRNFYYLTGLDGKDLILLAQKEADGSVTETVYLLPPDPLAERWSGRRVHADEAQRLSCVNHVEYVDSFAANFHKLAQSGRYEKLYLDLYKADSKEADRPAHEWARQGAYPFLTIQNVNPLIRRLRTIKQPCEIEALRRAESITKAGILAMMHMSEPGLYEYQYKAEFDRTLGQYGPEGPGFPSIISAGRNNFCIHYYSYRGQALDGDMVLNDVGAQWDGLITDVSRGFPCNGRFTDRQKLLFNCMKASSDHMFSIIRPGMRMADVDAEIRRYTFERLKDAGVLNRYEEIGTFMWHGGAHHIGYDVHDAVEMPETLAPGMTFCVDVGIYHEEWGIGFRLEDNCLVTEGGCENLSAAIPRSVEEIEDEMRR